MNVSGLKALPSISGSSMKHLDLRRRINITSTLDDIVLPPPRTWRGRIQTFFFSRGLLGILRGGSRAIAIASLLLLVPCLVGLQTPAANERIERRCVELDDIVVTWREVRELAADVDDIENTIDQHSQLDEARELVERERRHAISEAETILAKLEGLGGCDRVEPERQMLLERLHQWMDIATEPLRDAFSADTGRGTTSD